MKTASVRTLLFVGVAFLPAFAGNQILLRNLNPADGTPTVLAAGASGLFVLSTASPAGQQMARVVEVDLTGARVASLDLPQLNVAKAAAVDSRGDLIVIGSGQSLQGTVVKVSASLQSAVTMASLPAALYAVALDGADNIYLTGTTDSATFPITAGAYQTTPPYNGNFGRAADAFVTELSPSGAVLYSTFFGSDSTSCMGGSFCVGKYGVTIGTAIAADASGNVVVAGITTSNGLPTTPGALAASCNCGYNYSYGFGINSGFVAKFKPGATQQLISSTYLNTNGSPGTFSLNAIALDASGDVILGGTAGPGLPTTSGTFHLALGANPSSGAFLMKLNSSGTAVIWGSYFDNQDSAVQAVRVDPQGRVVFSGYAGNPAGAELQYKPTFVGRVTDDGATLIDLYPGPGILNLAGPALVIASSGGFASVVQAGALWIETSSPGPSILNVANSASGQYAGTIDTQELISLYGIGIGPESPLMGIVQNSRYTTSLDGYQVLINGVAAPLLYAGPGQINAVVPSAGSGSSWRIQVVTPAGTVDGPTIPLSDSPVPGVFQNGSTGLAAALNQDGSVNSPSNPAKGGSIVTIFADASSGQYFPDGTVVPLAVYDASLPVWVVDPYRSLAVEWAGAAPGIVAGVMQVNFRLPATLPVGGTFAFSLVVNGVSSGPSQLAVAQ